MKIIDGKKIAQELKEEIKKEVEKLDFKPVLAVILANDSEESAIYVRNKINAGEYVGIDVQVYKFEETNQEEEIVACLNKLNKDNKVCGIIIQSPVLPKFKEEYLTSLIDPQKDVDGFGITSLGLLASNKESYLSATPQGIIKLLEHENIDVKGKRVVIVGRSKIVGRPLALALLNKDATVTIAHSKTTNLAEVTKEADILIVAIGKAKFITKDYVKEGAIVIDVGINRIDNKLYGDVDFDDVKDIVSYISPVPGGVGPMTVACLLANTLKSAQKKGR